MFGRGLSVCSVYLCVCVRNLSSSFLVQVLDDQILGRLFWNVNFLVKLSLNHKLGKDKVTFFLVLQIKTSLKFKKKESSISF